MRGNAVKLLPGRNNRLYIMGHRQLTVGSAEIDMFSTIIEHTIDINIIPRWRGIRDV